MTEEAHAKIIISALSALKAFDPPAELFLKYYRFAEPVTIPESNKSSSAEERRPGPATRVGLKQFESLRDVGLSFKLP